MTAKKESSKLTVRSSRIAFIISHPFQFFFYEPLVQRFPNSFVVFETRNKTPFEFSADFIARLNCRHIFCDEKDLRSLADQTDIIFCMTPKHLQHNYKSVKLIAVQYGMAKEDYNYGLWRCLADLNLMYGDYSHNLICGFCVSQPVGNLRFDNFRKPSRLTEVGILYIPTYGELSSLQVFIEALPRIPTSIKVTVKLHHASEFVDRTYVELLKSYSHITIADGYTDALELIDQCDLVISDYSGSIFDAVYLNKPILLLQPALKSSVGRTSAESIEVASAHKFADVVKNVEELIEYISSLNERSFPKPKTSSSDHYFSNKGNAADAVVNSVEKLLNGEIRRNVVQRSIYNTYRKLTRKKSKHPILYVFKFIKMSKLKTSKFLAIFKF